MDSKPKRQLTEQQRANLAAGREKLKTLRADPDYSKQMKERRDAARDAARVTVKQEPVVAASATAEEGARKRSRSRGRSAAIGEESEAYSKSVPTLGN